MGLREPHEHDTLLRPSAEETEALHSGLRDVGEERTNIAGGLGGDKVKRRDIAAEEGKEHDSVQRVSEDICHQPGEVEGSSQDMRSKGKAVQSDNGKGSDKESVTTWVLIQQHQVQNCHRGIGL